MSSFTPTEQRIEVTCRRQPAFSRNAAVLVRLIKHLHKRMQDDANALLRPWGISHPEYNILMMLYGTGDGALHPSQLAEAAGEKSANITRLTDRLCEKGLIERTPSAEDRRKISLSLSRQGLAMVDEFMPAICGLLERQVEGMSDAEMTRLEHLLKKLLDRPAAS